jgi:vitamin B12 transporter
LGSDKLPWNFEEVKFNDTNISNTDIYTNFNTKFLENFHLDFGGRLTNNSEFKNHFIYSINPYYLKEFESTYYKIGFSYSTAFIAPTLYQVYGFSSAGTPPNANLKPEFTTEYEAGVDLRFLNDRIGLDVTYFSNRNTDMIIPLDVAPSSGATNLVINAGETTAKGLETSLRVTPIKNQDFRWD